MLHYVPFFCYVICIYSQFSYFSVNRSFLILMLLFHLLIAFVTKNCFQNIFLVYLFNFFFFYGNFEVKRLVFIRLRLIPPSLTALKTRNCFQKIHLLYFLLPIFLSIFVNANFYCTYPTLSKSSKDIEPFWIYQSSIYFKCQFKVKRVLLCSFHHNSSWNKLLQNNFRSMSFLMPICK